MWKYTGFLVPDLLKRLTSVYFSCVKKLHVDLYRL